MKVNTMLHRFFLPTLLCILLLAGAAPAQQPIEAEKALAERFAMLAQRTLRSSALVPARFEQAAALLQAAHELHPTEPRFLRLLAQAQRQSGNNQAAIDATLALARLEPRNAAVYAQLIDLYLSQMETADARLDYLETITSREPLPPAVRSYAAGRAAQLLVDQGAHQLAREMTQKALEWNPVNPIAARVNWHLTRDIGTTAQRTRALMTLVQASPADPVNVGLFAQQLADAGYVNSSLIWFSLATQLAQSAGLDAMPLYLDWAAELFIANEPFSAAALTDQLLEIDPASSDVWFLRLLIDRASGLEEPLAKSLPRARSALLQKFARLRESAGIQGPEIDKLPELSSDLELLRGEDASADLKAAYATTVADLLWLELYFAGPTAETDRLLEFLRQILPENNPTLARLEGWSFLLRDRKDEARVKLQAVADRDPLAALGLLRLADRDDASMQAMTRQGRELLSSHPSGVVGSFIAGELRRYGVRIELPQDLAELEPQVRRFTREWTRIYTDPGSFYVIRAEPLQVAHRVGEPILARIEIRNLSDYPLSIGPQGAIRPDLWIDARLQGVVAQEMGGIAYDTLMQDLVLQPKQSVLQVVRLDYSGLNDILNPNPSVSFQVTFWAMTNPRSVETQQGGTAVVPGPIGQRVQFLRLIERVAAPLFEQDQRVWKQVLDDLQGPLPVVKMDRIDLLRMYITQLRRVEQQEDLHRYIAEFLMQINRRREDETPIVSDWATYAAAYVAEGEDKAELLRQMRSEDNWIRKLLSLTIANEESQLAADVAQRLSGEEQPPIVRRFAQATLDAIEQEKQLQSETQAPEQ